MTDAAPDDVVVGLIERLMMSGGYGSYIDPDALPGWVFTSYGGSRGPWFGATPVAIRLPGPPRSATLPAS